MFGPSRRSVRLPGHNYGSRAGYFVTLCASERACLFGEIHEGGLFLSAVGSIVDEEWRKTAELRSNVVLDAYVVMPNHFHGIIFITQPSPVGPRAEGERASQRLAPTRTPRAGSLGTIMGQFKAAVSKRAASLADGPNVVWQRSYHEHIIRDNADLNRIRTYIAENPSKWHEDPENPVNRPELRSPT